LPPKALIQRLIMYVTVNWGKLVNIHMPIGKTRTGPFLILLLEAHSYISVNGSLKILQENIVLYLQP
jgi:hypothetical protein